jgi:hypothetical protein
MRHTFIYAFYIEPVVINQKKNNVLNGMMFKSEEQLFLQDCFIKIKMC